MSCLISNGHIQVMASRCETCIFEPGNKLNLSKGVVANMIRRAKRERGAIQCHSTFGGDVGAVCRGFYELHATAPLQIAARVGAIQEVTP